MCIVLKHFKVNEEIKSWLKQKNAYLVPACTGICIEKHVEVFVSKPWNVLFCMWFQVARRKHAEVTVRIGSHPI